MKDVDFTEDHPDNPNAKLRFSATIDTRLTADGRPLQQYKNYHNVIGMHSYGYWQHDFNWADDDVFMAGPNSSPEDIPQGRFQVTDDVLQVVSNDSVNYLSSKADADGNTVWRIERFDVNGRHIIVETVDQTGRLLSVSWKTRNEARKIDNLGWDNHSERYAYTYSPQGRLVKEVKTIFDVEDEGVSGLEETTVFRYLPSGIVSHVTTDKQGEEIRRGTRYYDSEGRFLSAKVVESLTGEEKVRRIGQQAISYEPHEKPFRYVPDYSAQK
jgi:hypothetical protein